MNQAKALIEDRIRRLKQNLEATDASIIESAGHLSEMIGNRQQTKQSIRDLEVAVTKLGDEV